MHTRNTTTKKVAINSEISIPLSNSSVYFDKRYSTDPTRPNLSDSVSVAKNLTRLTENIKSAQNFIKT